MKMESVTKGASAGSAGVGTGNYVCVRMVNVLHDRDTEWDE